jgi:5-methyltetrahydrofolate--homocysteine methyltransferase
MATLQEISEAVIAGDLPKTVELTNALLAEGLRPGVIITQGLIPAMNVVGEKFTNREYYVPDMLISARAMQGALKILKPMLVESEQQQLATCVIGTVKGDLHDIGKNLVSMMLEGSGFTVVDLGADVDIHRFVEAIKDNQAQIVGLSALLTTTMTVMKDVIAALEEAGIRDKVKVIIGGAPVTKKYADEIGADGYAEDAPTGVKIAKSLLGLN